MMTKEDFGTTASSLKSDLTTGDRSAELAATVRSYHTIPFARLTGSAPAETLTYLVQCDQVIGGRRTIYWPERANEDTTYRKTLDDIVSGEIEGVSQVIAISSAGTYRDVTEDVARDVMRAASDRHGELSFKLREFCERQLGCEIVADAERLMAAGY